MRIILAQHFGLCFGVRDAINHATDLAREGPLTILGELVHNPVVREQLKRQGVQEGSLDDAQSSSPRVMITAHGASDRQRQKWKQAGYEVADATCPLVRYAHDQLKRLVESGYFPVVIGKVGHVEVRGLTEDFEQAFVFDDVDQLDQLPLHPAYGIISQTTQPIEHVGRMLQAIRLRCPTSKVQFVDTVCRPTKDRQLALRQLIEEADVIVVVGGYYSNNTRQLVQTCRKAGRTTFHVECAEQLESAWFIAAATVGLTAGTSTLPETVTAVHERLRQISAENSR
jgi:4-hydroxy-3-methylbut-2-enyl diphosphate reductase